MSDQKRPEKEFEKLIEDVAIGKVTWQQFEQKLAAADLSASEQGQLRTTTQCRRIDQLKRDPTKSGAKLEEELSAFPALTEATRQYIDKFFCEALVEGAVLEGLRARGKWAGPFDDARDVTALYRTCHPRDGTESALARLIPMLLHAVTGCFERAENSESLEARHHELISGFRGARVVALISDSLRSGRRERSHKK
jgi:hypothetical protein